MPSLDPVDWTLFIKALAVQLAAVVALSLALVALPLPEDFFRDYGFVAGPLAWAVCALITARVLSMGALHVLLAAAAGGIVGTMLSLLGGHWPGVAAGLVAFGAGCAVLGGRRAAPSTTQTGALP
jgi:hypothetical protein